MAEDLKGGKSTGACTAWASTRPEASDKGMVSEWLIGTIWASSHARASSKSFMSFVADVGSLSLVNAKYFVSRYVG